MRRAGRVIPLESPWIDGDLWMTVGTNAVTIAPGSRQRGLPCIVCQTPSGGQPCHLIAVVAGLLCPADASHLGAVGLFCHARCLPAQESAIARAVAAVFAGLGH